MDSRERITDAATALFVRDGYKATSLKAIAAEVGMSPPALLWHFDSKEQLFLAAMERLLDRFLEQVDAAVTATEPGPRLRQFVGAHVRWKLEQREASGIWTSTVGLRDLLHSVAPGPRRALVAKQRDHLARLRAILDEGVRQGAFRTEDVGVTAFAIITLCEYVHSWYDPDGELSPDDVAERYGDLVLTMVGAAPAR